MLNIKLQISANKSNETQTLIKAKKPNKISNKKQELVGKVESKSI